MKRYDYILLFALQFCVILTIAQFQPIPGNIDADYYFMGGVQLAQGKGFTEPYIWNYLDDPAGLPHPSHAYWMPLASILAALGMALTGQQTYESGRLVFILLASCIPPITAALSYQLIQRRELAIVSGLLAVFSVYYLPPIGITENHAIFMTLGGLYLLLMRDSRRRVIFILGLISGLMSLARSDGLIWLAFTFLLILRHRAQEDPAPLLSRPKIGAAFTDILLALSGFLVIMAPWYIRNISVFGAPMTISARRALWLTDYWQTFIYPANLLTFENWLASGWRAILDMRLWSLGKNTVTALVVQGGLVMWPSILLGIRAMRSDDRVKLGVLAWTILFFVLTAVFPMAGAHGSFYHAGAAIQPLWWALSPVGMESFVSSLQKRGWLRHPKTFFISQSLLVELAFFLSLICLWLFVFSDKWDKNGESTYPKIESFLVSQGIQPNEPVIVMNPPGYTMMTGRPAIVQPYGNEQTFMDVAERYHARFIIIEPKLEDDVPHKDLYENPHLYPRLRYLGEVDAFLIFIVDTAP